MVSTGLEERRCTGRRRVWCLVVVLGVCGLSAACRSGITRIGDVVSVGRCQVRLVYRPGRALYGDVYMQTLAPDGKEMRVVHVTDIDMPPEQFDIIHLRIDDGPLVRAYMEGHEREPYEAVAPVPRECRE